MADEHQPSESSRELRLEGPTLFVACGALAALLAGAFFTGRWFERKAAPRQVVTSTQPGPLDPLVQTEPPLDTSDRLTFFDDVRAGREEQLEPSRELALPERSADPAVVERPARPTERESEPAVGPGETPAFYVQVFAGRDRASAEGLVDRLQTQGYEVRMFTQREGAETLFKVRVGGYETQDLARSKALELQRAGYSGAFVGRSS